MDKIVFEMTYKECDVFAQWFNSLDINMDEGVPDEVNTVLERLNKVVESPESV